MHDVEYTTPLPSYPPDCTSYYGLTFLLPRYYDDISGGEKDFVYILSALLGASFIPGTPQLSLSSRDA